MWNNIEFLSKFHSILQWIAAIGGIVTAIAIIFSLLFGSRLSTLQKEKENQLQKKIEQLESVQIGRRLNLRQRKTINETFAIVSKTKLVFIGIQGDRESIIFAKDLYDTFKKIGWNVEGVNEEIYLGGVGFGITIRQKKSNLIGNKISEVLSNFGFRSNLLIKETMDDSHVEIIVAHKP